MDSARALDDMLAARLVAGAIRAPLPEGVSLQDLATRVAFHGIAPMLYADPASFADWPEATIAALREEAVLQSFWESSHRAAIARALAALAGADCPALVMKGTALAYSVYAEPQYRRRGDTDLLVRESNLALVRVALIEAGFARERTPAGVTHAETWTQRADEGFVHAIDLHWQVRSAPVLQGIVQVDECFERAEPLPRLAAGAKAVDPVLTFIQGAVNQAWHAGRGFELDGQRLYDGGRLIWALDNHLLAAGFTPAQWQELADLSERRGVAPVTLAALELARRSFGSAVPDAVLAQLRQAAADTPQARYLAHPGRIADILGNLAALPDWRQRLAYLRTRLGGPRLAGRA